MTATPLVFLDLETTGLDPHTHQIWEAAWITRITDSSGTTERKRYQTFVQHDANKAIVLPVQFRRDWAERYDTTKAIGITDLVNQLLRTIPVGAHLVGACPWFDQEFLRVIWGGSAFSRNDEGFPWHYHLIDTEALAIGYLRGQAQMDEDAVTTQPPWDSDWLSNAVGVDPTRFERHTAMGDCEWAEAMYDAVMA